MNHLCLPVVFVAVSASAVAQVQFEEFRQGVFPANTGGANAIALGDIDGDGDLDIVFGNDGHQNRLFLNDRNIKYIDATGARMPADSDTTWSVALGDVDGDGDLDIVFGNGKSSGQQNRLYLNEGSGTFTDATAGRMPPDSDVTKAVALGDVDNDGDLDMILGNESGARNRLYLNDGTGIFIDDTTTRVPDGGSQALALGDVDNDGDLDMVLGNGGGGRNGLFLNDGAGIFIDSTMARMPDDGNNTQAVALGDVDGDGDLDIVMGNGEYTNEQNRLYLNDGSGAFSDVTAVRMPLGSDATKAIALGDVDGDGDLDMIVGNFGSPPYGAQSNRLLVNDGAGNYIDASASRMPEDRDFTRTVALGDVDNDGDLDMLIGANRLYLNDSSGVYTDANELRMPEDGDLTRAVALGDVDGDGDLDMVLANSDSQNRLYLNDGTGSYTDATSGRMPGHDQSTVAVALGDVDGDGDLDIIFGNGEFRGPQNRLYLNDGTGTYADATAARMPVDTDPTTAVALGDVDGDSDLDLVIGNTVALLTQSQLAVPNRLYLNDGTGVFGDATTVNMPVDSDRTTSVALGDVDNDGDLDMVFGNGGGQNRLYVNDGTGVYGDATTARMPVDNDATVAMALGDVDGDGDLDMVLLSQSGIDNGYRRLYLNDGGGTYTDASAARMTAIYEITNAVALGDVDRDGDLDIVFGNTSDTGGRQNRIYLNLLRQLETPWRPRLARSFAMDFYARPGFATSFHTAIPALNLFLAPTPLALGPLGILYLDVSGAINLPWVAIPPSTGKGTLEVTVPADTTLVGQIVYVQALIVNNAKPWTDSHLTGYTADVIIR